VIASIPIVIDTDVGDDPDDALALVLALASPEVDVRGVRIVSGDVAWRARIATQLLGMAERSDVPVFLGAGIRIKCQVPKAKDYSAVRTRAPRRQSRPLPRSTGSSPNRTAGPFTSSLSVR
jgi:inosine-uridine nucleoside N-ribohydrolase